MTKDKPSCPHCDRGIDPDWQYLEGQRSVARKLIRVFVRELGLPNQDASEAENALYIDEIRSSLRSACAEHGDNDWQDDLHLVDVIEKHLCIHILE